MPQFPPGAQKIARAPITVIPSGLSCQAELYLVSDSTKVVTSGLIPFTSTGAAQDITFPITMPGANGSYHVYLDIFVSGTLIAAYVAEDVLIAAVAPLLLVATAEGSDVDRSYIGGAGFGCINSDDDDISYAQNNKSFANYMSWRWSTVPVGSIIDEIAVYWKARLWDFPLAYCNAYFKSAGGVRYMSDVKLIVKTGYTLHSWPWPANPATGLPWVASDINNGEFGFYWGAGLTYFARLTYMYIEIK